MSQQTTNPNPPTQPEQEKKQFEPCHVMTREHYERLAREAAGQK
ncbi:hypothetical protein [Duganella sp. LjRoot269]